MPTPAYAALEAHFRRAAVLDQALDVLHWDSAVMLPEGAAAARGEHMASLAALRHDLFTDPRTADLLAEAEGTAESLDPWQAANLHEMRRAWSHASAVPADLVEALSRAASTCERVWRSARPQSDFAAVRPHLDEVVRLVREQASAKAEALGLSPYDALLDQYEPGGRAAAIDTLFADLEGFLPEFLGQVLDHQRRSPLPPLPPGPFPQAAQEAVGRRLMAAVGFDFAQGRLDTSAHPFCGGTPYDVRLTTRYDEADFSSALMGVLHETGHALYERGLPEDWRGQPVGQARGMGLHESQSLLVEMQVCRSRPFFTFAAPLLAEAFGASPRAPEWQVEALHRRAIAVEPGFIRVDADEVTYPAHVILRYRLERALIDGSLSVADLPAAWNEGFTRLLGLAVPEDRLGCLQDIHWFDGAFGYFPTYTLGALTAAQIFQAAQRAVPGCLEAIAQGDFTPLVSWLRREVHGRASLLPTPALIEAICGQPLSAEVFKAHLRARYLGAEDHNGDCALFTTYQSDPQ